MHGASSMGEDGDDDATATVSTASTATATATAGVSKLITTLHDKANVVVHYRNLKQYLTLGMELVCVHKVLCFRQAAWLSSYISVTTALRQNAVDNLMKCFAKLMINSIFGKTIEDVRKYRNIKIVTSEKQFAKEIRKPNFLSGHLYSSQLGAVELTRKKIQLSKPRYVGTTVLALAKHIMYHFHYNLIPSLFPHTKLLFTDTGIYYSTYHLPHTHKSSINKVLPAAVLSCVQPVPPRIIIKMSMMIMIHHT